MTSIKSQARHTFLRVLTLATVASSFSIPIANAQEEQSGPKIRILGPRDGQPSNTAQTTVIEPAGSRSKVAMPIQQPTVQQPSRPVVISQPQKQPPIQPSPSADRSASQTPSRPPANAEEQTPRQRALMRLNKQNASGSTPVQAGVPQLTFRGQSTTRVVSAPTPTPQPAATNADASQSQNPPEASVAPEVPFTLSAGKVVDRADVLASEVSRIGADYFFTGLIYGTKVRYRINNDISGIKIPSRLANSISLLPPEARSIVAKNQEINIPIISISFGAYQIHSVMGTIYSDETNDVIDVGPDALSMFKIKEANGRRFLTRG